ncbi:MAG TPA: hypothetical protein VIE89_01080 [Candidatus Binatia bacterium]|jgi:hypothetical protein
MTQEQRIGNLGYFEFQPPNEPMQGVIIGAPHGVTEPDSAIYAKSISQQTGAGFLIASGFASKRLPVTQPLVRWTPSPAGTANPLKRGNVYREFNALLRQAANGNVKLYVGVRSRVEASAADRIEVATSGFTFEQLAILKKSFVRIRDSALAGSSIPKIAIAIDPLEKISWRVSGVKHHGVLMFAERGLNLRLPQGLSTGAAESSYAKIIATWVAEVSALLEDNNSQLDSVVRLTDYGRIESLPSRKRQNGIVIGAPHGTFDEYTAELVNQVSYRTGLAAVIARGFTPTECGGWRINVNRPTERLYPSDSLEIHSERAQDVYQLFKQSVLEASRGNLNLYIDVHQNGRQKNIEVATVGISKGEAQIIKKSYREIRDRVLESNPDVTSVDLVIEPLDNIEIGAWAAKAQGILGLAKKSLHFELPLYDTLGTSKARDSYTEIVTLLLDRTVPLLSKR